MVKLAHCQLNYANYLELSSSTSKSQVKIACFGLIIVFKFQLLLRILSPTTTINAQIRL